MGSLALHFARFTAYQKINPVSHAKDAKENERRAEDIQPPGPAQLVPRKQP